MNGQIKLWKFLNYFLLNLQKYNENSWDIKETKNSLPHHSNALFLRHFHWNGNELRQIN